MLKRSLWKIFRRIYMFVAKPLLFMISPDTAHNLMIKSTSFFGRFLVFRWIVKSLFCRKPNKLLSQDIHGIKINSPVGLAAGFDKNGEILPMISRLGFGFATIGSVTANECDGNPRPWFYRLPNSKSLVINAGLANQGSKSILNRISKYGKIVNDFPVVLSVAKTNSAKVISTKGGIKDYVTSVTRSKNESNISMIELNISCPNAFGGEAFTTPERLDKLLLAVDKVKSSKPIFVKMPIDHEWLEFKKLLDVICRHNIAGVTVSNLAKDRKAAELQDNLPDSVKGNLSGRPTWSRSNDLIGKTFTEYGGKLTIIGVGGIFTAEDAYTKIKLGASLVEIITGVIFCGPQLAAEISDDLALLLRRDGFENISQAVGIDAK